MKLDLGAAIESMTAESKAVRFEARQTNQKLDLLLRSQTETRRQLHTRGASRSVQSDNSDIWYPRQRSAQGES